MLHTIYSEISDMLKELSGIDGEILPDESLNRYGFESLKTMKLIVALELKYNFEVDDEELMIENFSTINRIVNYIMAKQTIDH